MQGAGSALMGIGSARGGDRAVQAAELAISSPLLEASIDGAYGVLLSIQGGSDLGLFEINEAARLVQEAAHPEANIIFGAVIDDALGDEVRVTVIAAGFDGGTPVQRPNDRALGQVSGRAPTAHERPAVAAAAPNGGVKKANGYRPYGGQEYEPAPASQPDVVHAAAPAPQQEKVVVPDSLEPVGAGRSRVFDDSDDLDVPDFLK
jgi:cell division protein FtsZ